MTPEKRKDQDEAQRPVEEGGGGVAEGFELSEEQLIENAEHGEPGYPGAEAFADQEEEIETVHGEADEVESTAVDRDGE